MFTYLPPLLCNSADAVSLSVEGDASRQGQQATAVLTIKILRYCAIHRHMVPKEQKQDCSVEGNGAIQYFAADPDSTAVVRSQPLQ